MIQITTCVLMALLTAQQGDVSKQARKLIEQLRSDDPAVRDAATAKLRGLGKAAKPELEKIKEDRDEEVSRRARFVLLVIELRDKLTPELQKAIPDAVDRLAAGTKQAWTKVFLEAASRYHHRRLLRKDLEVLAGPALRGSKTAEEKVGVCNTLASRLLVSTVSEIHPLLQDESGEVRGAAAACLARLRVKEAIPEITKLLDDTDTSARGQAVSALASLAALDAVPRIRELLKDGDSKVRTSAVRAIVDLQVKEAVPEIVGLLEDEDYSVRTYSARALGELGAKESVPRIVELLRHENTSIQAAAVEALAALHATEHARELIPLLSDASLSLRGYALRALKALSAEETIPDLLKVLRDGPTATDRHYAAEALGAMRAKEAVPELLKVLRNGGVSAMGAAEALGLLGVKEAAPDIVELLKDAGLMIPQQTYIMALGRLRSKDAIPELARWVKEADDPFIRYWAARAIGDIDAAQGISHLRPMLVEDKAWLDQGVASQLCRLGSTDGVSRLLELAEDDAIWSSLWPLNALRHPDQWARLEGKQITKPIYGSVNQILQKLAEESGMELKIEGTLLPEHKLWLERHMRVPSTGGVASLTDVLGSVFWNQSSHELILEDSHIRVVPRKQALKFWKAWWAEEQKKR